MHGHQGPADQVGLGRLLHPDGDVGRPHVEVEFVVVQQQGDLDLGKALDELADARGQPGRAQSGRAGDAQRPFGLALAFRDHRLGRDQLDVDLLDRVVQPLPLFRQDQAARVAVEQRRAEAVLQRADLPADGGLAQAQRFAGMGEGPRLGDRVKDAQLVPIQHE